MVRIRHNHQAALASIALGCGALAFAASCVVPSEHSAGDGGQPGTPPPPTTAPAVTGGAIALQTRQVPNLGLVLTGPDGRTLYMFDKDHGSQSACTDGCASSWPPLTTNGAPTVGAGLNPHLLSTTQRADGRRQVVYNGHPLYYYVGDQLPGHANGQTVSSNSGTWFAVSPTGNEIDIQTGGR